MCPGRYLTFSCSVLMISVSRRPPTSSSSTHMFTWFSKVLSRAALLPVILAMAEPLRGQSRAVGSGRRGCWHRGAQCNHSSLGVLVKLGRLAPGTGVHWGGRGLRCARRGDPGAHAAGAHQLPEPTTQTFLPPMVRGAEALCGTEPAAGISRPPGAGAAPSRPRPRLAPGGTGHPCPGVAEPAARWGLRCRCKLLPWSEGEIAQMSNLSKTGSCDPRASLSLFLHKSILFSLS